MLEDVRQDTALAPNGTTNGTTTARAVNGASEENGAGVNGKKSDATNGTSSNGVGARPSLAIPQSVVDEALKVTRDCLDTVCDIDESGAT